MSTAWPIVSMDKLITLRKEFITIDDLETYKRARVRLHAQGIVLRDEVPGALIKTKKQQVCRAGEFLVAEIDAKVGGFGIVPKNLDNAIVSSHYFLFEPNPEHIERRFLGWFIKTPAFREQVSAQGSTNYAAIRPSDVLSYRIPLPPLAEQQRIVAWIEQLAAKIAEARNLRVQAEKEAEAFVISVHIKLSGKRTKKLGEMLKLDEDKQQISATGSYPQVGVRSFGGGLFSKSAVTGAQTTYRTFNRLYSGAFVLSQVKGWEGAVAVCPDDLAGWYVSPEYRTFRCLSDEARSAYLLPIVKSEWFWGKLNQATRGVGARRERTRPEQFLDIELPMPEVEQQILGEKLFMEIGELKRLHSQTAAELDALLPSILDRAFKGEL